MKNGEKRGRAEIARFQAEYAPFLKKLVAAGRFAPARARKFQKPAAASHFARAKISKNEKIKTGYNGHKKTPNFPVLVM